MGNLTSADNNPLTAIRAVLISLYPKDVNNSLVPKMRERGVDVVRVVNIERSPDFKPGDVDVIICMRDYFSHSLYSTVKTIARRYNRPLLTLTRKASDWEELLAGYVTRARQAPPASSPQPLSSRAPLQLVSNSAVVLPPDEPEEKAPEVSSTELRELLAMFEAENTRLEGEIKPLMKRLEETDALAGILEKRIEEGDALAKEAALDFKRSIAAHRANNTRLSAQVQRLEEELAALTAGQHDTSKERTSTLVLEQQRVIEELRDELTTTRKQLKEEQWFRTNELVVTQQTTIAELRQESSKGIDKEMLLLWDRLLRGVRSGNAPDFQALLEFSAKADISAAELLALLKG